MKPGLLLSLPPENSCSVVVEDGESLFIFSPAVSKLPSGFLVVTPYLLLPSREKWRSTLSLLLETPSRIVLTI